MNFLGLFLYAFTYENVDHLRVNKIFSYLKSEVLVVVVIKFTVVCGVVPCSTVMVVLFFWLFLCQ